MENRVSDSQLSDLLDYLDSHPGLLRSGASVRNKDALDREWNRLAVRLNAHVPGANKPGIRWRRYWADLKHKAKVKAIHRRRTGEDDSALCDADRRILAIIKKTDKGAKRYTLDNTVKEKEPLKDSSEEEELECIKEENIVAEGIKELDVELDELLCPSTEGLTHQNSSSSSGSQRVPSYLDPLNTGFESPKPFKKVRSRPRFIRSVLELERRRVAAEERLASAALLLAAAARDTARAALRAQAVTTHHVAAIDKLVALLADRH